SALALGLPPLGPVRCSRPSGAALLRCPQTPSAGVSALALGLPPLGPVRCSRPSGAALLRCPQTPSAGVSALALGLPPLGPVRCSRPSGAALLRCPQTPSAGVSALALGLPPLGPARCSRPSGAALLRCPQPPSAGVSALALGLPPLLGRASSRGLRQCSPASRAAHCGMPPDPVGRRERSRARPPPAVGAGVFARAPSVLGPLRGLRTAGCPQTPSAGENALAAPATLQACGGLGRAKPAGPRLLRRRVRSRGGPAEDPVARVRRRFPKPDSRVRLPDPGRAYPPSLRRSSS